ncbi:TetR/AcrR family transcriptional regulator [Streptomyces sp. NPDC101234]|uniref:TetR/AcrR family transcriptional regulator n=1 Tax=Streptomyces sp. NPDC101234 TaxID=3366138 RepID=UPI00381EAE69
MHAEQTWADLTTAARGLCVGRGFADTWVKTVTRAATVNRGTFHHHFSGRKAMFAEPRTELLQQVAALGDATAEAAGSTPDTPPPMRPAPSREPSCGGAPPTRCTVN